MSPVPVVALARTDDRGEFRLAGVPEGPFFLSAEYEGRFALTPAGALQAFVQTFWPGVKETDKAKAILIQQGEERRVSMTLSTAPLLHIGGVVQDATGEHLRGRNAIVRVLRAGSALPIKILPLRPDGAFDVDAALLPGRYSLSVSVAATPGGTNHALFGRQPIDSDGRRDIVARITVVPGGSLAGSVRIAGQTPAEELRIFARPLRPDGALIGSISAAVAPNGTFQLKDVFDASHLVVNGKDGWSASIDRVTVGGVDVTQTGVFPRSGTELKGVDVYVTGSGTSVNGVVTNGSLPASHAVVVVMANTASPLCRLIGALKTDAKGQFIFRGLAPGSYGITAIPQVDTAYISRPEYLHALAQKSEPLEISATNSVVPRLTLRHSPSLPAVLAGR
jgi:hypothetical protein